jgi:hypothetical protein
MAALRTKGRRGHGRQKSGERRLTLEHLETRAMLAGNVSVSVSGGSLLVRGNNSSNQIAIVQLDAGEYAVVGLNGTKVNGGTDPVVKSGVDNNIDIDLKKGNDVVGIGNDIETLSQWAEGFGIEIPDATLPAGAPSQLKVPRNLNIRLSDGNDAAAVIAKVDSQFIADLGNGNDSLIVQGSKVGGDFIVRGGNGHDLLYTDGTEVARTYNANMGNGRNAVELWNSSIGRSAVIISGKDGDVIDIADSAIEDNLIVRTGSGHDEVYAHSHGAEGMVVGNNVDINTGSGNDYVDVAGDIDNLLVLVTGNGNDEVFLEDLEAEDLVAVLGSGNDYMEAVNVEIGDNALLDAGSGNDRVYIEDSIVDDVFTALMGSGNDFLEICNSVAKKANLQGGSGKDELRSDYPDPLPSSVNENNFELFSECVEDEVEEELLT